jgi:hypothetical protein
MPAKRVFPKTKSHNVFGQTRKSAKMFRAGLYARVSTNDQQTVTDLLATLQKLEHLGVGFLSATQTGLTADG